MVCVKQNPVKTGSFFWNLARKRPPENAMNKIHHKPRDEIILPWETAKESRNCLVFNSTTTIGMTGLEWSDSTTQE